MYLLGLVGPGQAVLAPLGGALTGFWLPQVPGASDMHLLLGPGT